MITRIRRGAVVLLIAALALLLGGAGLLVGALGLGVGASAARRSRRPQPEAQR